MTESPGEALEAPTSRLIAALLRIGSGLDLETVLREVVDGARGLTGARAGMLVTVDDAGRVEACVASGLTPAQERRMAAGSDGSRLAEHFRGLAAPLRLDDLPAWLRGLGFSSDPIRSKTFLGGRRGSASPGRRTAATTGSAGASGCWRCAA